MESVEGQNNKRYAFYAGSLFCVYELVERGNEVILFGMESEQGTRERSDMLSFSNSQKKRAEAFMRILAQSRTLPRMMTELAEEYFL